MPKKLDKKELLERYEATGDEGDYLAALPLYEEAARNGADAETFKDYGYLLECHARNQLRQAVEHYERAIELDPDNDKPRYQLISARAGLQEPELPIAGYKRKLESSPEEIRWYRLLSSAYLKSHDYKRAGEVVDRGLALAPHDPMLVGCRAEVRAGNGDAEGALADWHRALELDPDHIGPLYMSAFLLERIGRRQEAMYIWQAIIDWSAVRGYELDTIWPKQELARLQQPASRRTCWSTPTSRMRTSSTNGGSKSRRRRSGCGRFCLNFRWPQKHPLGISWCTATLGRRFSST